MKPLAIAAGVALSALATTPTSASASVVFEFEPTKLAYFTEASGKIVVSDEAYQAGRLRRWACGAWNPAGAWFGTATPCQPDIMPEELEYLSVGLSKNEGGYGAIMYTPDMHDEWYMNGALMFDLTISKGEVDTIDGLIFAGYGGFPDQAKGMLSDFGYGSDGIEACWGAENMGSEVCGAAGVWRRVSDPSMPTSVPEPATAALILAGLIGAARFRPSQCPS